MRTFSSVIVCFFLATTSAHGTLPKELDETSWKLYTQQLLLEMFPNDPALPRVEVIIAPKHSEKTGDADRRGIRRIVIHKRTIQTIHDFHDENVYAALVADEFAHATVGNKALWYREHEVVIQFVRWYKERPLRPKG